jgi:hypothetical protein
MKRDETTETLPVEAEVVTDEAPMTRKDLFDLFESRLSLGRAASLLRFGWGKGERDDYMQTLLTNVNRFNWMWYHCWSTKHSTLPSWLPAEHVRALFDATEALCERMDGKPVQDTINVNEREVKDPLYRMEAAISHLLSKMYIQYMKEENKDDT